MNSFAEVLYRWSEEHPRPMPWRQERNPYKIWISEMMLQQTRVEQVVGFYQRFLTRFPDVQSLAAAEESEVLKYWEGLGYNSRARNLHQAAKQVVEHHGGIFPGTAAGLLTLKGVGPYAAAAIASFAYAEPVPVLDTNVYRVAARLNGFTEPMLSTKLQDRVQHWLTQVFDSTAPGRFNQAIMDFGALQCLSRLPECTSCPFTQRCYAYRERATEMFPVKAPKAARKPLELFYFVICTPQGLVMRHRTQDDVWKGLYEFEMADKSILEATPGQRYATPLGKIEALAAPVKHQQTLTHRSVTAHFLVTKPIQKLKQCNGYFLATTSEIKKKYAVPGVIRAFLANFDTPL